MKFRMIHVAFLVSALLFLSVFAGSVSAVEQEDQTTKITILHTNDSHARVFEGEFDGMGFAKLSTLIKQQEALNQNALVLDAGDTFHGQTFATQKNGSVFADTEGRIAAEEAVVAEAVEEAADEAAQETGKASAQEELMYIVQPGDWLMKIARRFDTTWQRLKEINQIANENLIFPGQPIRLSE